MFVKYTQRISIESFFWGGGGGEFDFFVVKSSLISARFRN